MQDRTDPAYGIGTNPRTRYGKATMPRRTGA
jgi:hypothetical protein